MSKSFFLVAALSVANLFCARAEQPTDSTRMLMLQEIEIVAMRADSKTPIAYTTIDRETIGRMNSGADLPFLLMMTPSVVVTSDAGAGIGYTGIRIRGTDASRINVTANGIPMNDAESHNMFWVNVPDIVASVADVQIQRGVGTSTNGAGAFGGSINLRTESLMPTPYAELSASFGSYNSHRESINVGTGLIGKDRWALNLRLSNIGSDGYIDRASTKLKSYFIQAGYYGARTTVKFITFAGKEQTYHAWNGQTREEIAERGRRYNPCGEIEDADGRVVGFYRDQTDNYTQSNYQLLFSHHFSSRWSMNLNLHYTDGDGYYEEYKNKQALEEYGLAASTVGDQSNLVRRKGMDNGFGGAVFSLSYKVAKLDVSLGGAVNKYDGDQMGRVMWLQSHVGGSDFRPEHEYYRNNGRKVDANIYLRANWQAVANLYLFGDVQYRHINHKLKGDNDSWDWSTGAMQKMAIDVDYDFFNPKFGAMYKFSSALSLYASLSMAHKEPNRNNLTEAKLDAMPRAERMMDYELGLNYNRGRFSASANLYYMHYKDQLVLTGELNHIGEPLTDNVDRSYRAGVELSAGVQIATWLRWDVNATFSRNKIDKYTEYLDDTDVLGGYIQTANYLGSTDIALSPNVIAGSLISAEYRRWTFALHSQYVGSQYLNNSKQRELKLDDYFLNNIRLGYSFSLGAVRSVELGVAANNIFNTKYSSNGYGGSYYEQGASGAKERQNWSYYFPQAGTNIVGSISIRF